MEKMNSAGLAENNGKNGRKTYVAVNGRVYDLSSSHVWKDGSHFTHFAGQDLSEAMKIAPHKDDVLEKYRVVAETAAEHITRPSGFKNIFLNCRPHAWIVRFPIAFFTASVVFYVIFLVTLRSAFERTSFHLLAAGVITSPLAALAGYATWAWSHGAVFSGVFAKKIFLAIALMVTGAACLRWRVNNPLVVFPSAGLNFIYPVMLGALAVMTVLLAYLGMRIRCEKI